MAHIKGSDADIIIIKHDVDDDDVSDVLVFDGDNNQKLYSFIRQSSLQIEWLNDSLVTE